MHVTMNDKQLEIESGQTVADLLESQGLAGRPCAVEVNRELVPKRDHATRTLAEGDRVEVVTLVGGG
jgi:sulfur carrier protein